MMHHPPRASKIMVPPEDQPALVYLVDDDESIRFSIVESMPKAWDICEFSSAETMLAAVGKSKPDLIISDLRLPGLSGKELVGFIRQKKMEMPIIFISGLAERDDLVELSNLRVHSYFDKPFSPESLVESAKEAIKHWKYLQSLEHQSLLSELEIV